MRTAPFHVVFSFKCFVCFYEHNSHFCSFAGLCSAMRVCSCLKHYCMMVRLPKGWILDPALCLRFRCDVVYDNRFAKPIKQRSMASTHSSGGGTIQRELPFLCIQVLLILTVCCGLCAANIILFIACAVILLLPLF